MAIRDSLSSFDENATTVGMTDEEIAATEQKLGRKIGEMPTQPGAPAAEAPPPDPAAPGRSRDDKGRFAPTEPAVAEPPAPAPPPAAAPPPGAPETLPPAAAEPAKDPTVAALEARVAELSERNRKRDEREERLMELAMLKNQPAPEPPPAPVPPPEIDPDLKANMDPYWQWREDQLRKEIMTEVEGRFGAIEPTLQSAQKGQLQDFLKDTFGGLYNEAFYDEFERSVKSLPVDQRQRYNSPEGVELLGRRILDKQPAPETAPEPTPTPKATSNPVARAHTETASGEEPPVKQGDLTPQAIMAMSAEEHAARIAALERRHYGDDNTPDPLLTGGR